MSYLCILFLLVIISYIHALYNANSDVVQVSDADFSKEVLKYPGIVMVEFYAPW